mmetsp:Transcript_121028/g.353672  ORF Transcript_121028/g.353672 Transcript_121028/m.353672 type:complete len:666 (+) Transcript_121028:68-2065(+)
MAPISQQFAARGGAAAAALANGSLAEAKAWRGPQLWSGAASVCEPAGRSAPGLAGLPNSALAVVCSFLPSCCFLALIAVSGHLALCEAVTAPPGWDGETEAIAEEERRRRPFMSQWRLGQEGKRVLVSPGFKVRCWIGWFPSVSSFDAVNKNLHSPSLRVLHLASSHTGIPLAAGRIAELMPKLTGLEVLGLQVPKNAWHTLCDGWVKKLAVALEQFPPPLVRLSLPGINVTKPACIALGKAIAASSTISLVELHNAAITPRGWQELVGLSEQRNSLRRLPDIVWVAKLEKPLAEELQRRGLRAEAAGGTWRLSSEPPRVDLLADSAVNDLLLALKRGMKMPRPVGDGNSLRVDEWWTGPRHYWRSPVTWHHGCGQCCTTRKQPEEPEQPAKRPPKPPNTTVLGFLGRKLDEGVNEKKPSVALAAAREIGDWGRRCDDEAGNQVAETIAQKLRHGLIVSVKKGQVAVADACVGALVPFVRRFKGAKTTGEFAMQRLIHIVDDSMQKGDLNVVATAASALLEFSDCPSGHVSHAVFGLLRVLKESVHQGQAEEAHAAVSAVHKLQAVQTSSKPTRQVVESLLVTIEDSLQLDEGRLAQNAARVLVDLLARCREEPVQPMAELVAQKLMQIWKRALHQGEAKAVYGVLQFVATEMSSMWETTCMGMH